MRDVAPDVQRNTDFKDRRVVVLVLDDATPMPAVDTPRVREYARDVVGQLGPHDLAAVVFPLNKGLGQDFTLDRARLLAAVARFNGAIDGQAGVDSRGSPNPKMPFDGFDVAAATLYNATLGTLQGAAQDLIALPERRKALIFVSVGIPLDITAAGPMAIGTSTADAGGVARQLITGMIDCFAAAQRGNVTIYPIDPGGLRAPGSFAVLSADPANPGWRNREFLQAVADNTGGFAVINTNDPAPGITQVFRENASYYLLGYAASNTRADGRFRKIAVRVNRPGVTVRTRKGYYEPTPVPRRDAAAPLRRAEDRALAGLLPTSGLDMDVTAVPFAVPGRRDAAVAVVLGVRQPAPAGAVRAVHSIDMRVAAYSPDGRQQAGTRQTIPITLNVPGSGATIGYELLSRLDLAPGRYQVRLAAESSRRAISPQPAAVAGDALVPDERTASVSGSVYCDLDVPDFANAPMSLSGVLLSVTPGVASGPKDALKAIVPVVPTMLREFARSDQVTAFLRVYQGGTRALVPVALNVAIADDQDAAVVKTSETLSGDRFANGRAADYFLDLPIARLKGGPHLLTIEARIGDRAARRDVRFDMR
jgi:VWFA-related protein